MNLLVDIGNTSIKFSSFVDKNLKKISQIRYSKKDLKSLTLFFKNKLKTHTKIYICSVVSEDSKLYEVSLVSEEKAGGSFVPGDASNDSLITPASVE